MSIVEIQKLVFTMLLCQIHLTLLYCTTSMVVHECFDHPWSQGQVV